MQRLMGRVCLQYVHVYIKQYYQYDEDDDDNTDENSYV